MTADNIYYPFLPDHELSVCTDERTVPMTAHPKFDVSLAIAPWAGMYLDIFAERNNEMNREAASKFLDAMPIRLGMVERTQERLATQPWASDLEVGPFLRELCGYLASAHPANRATFIFDFDADCRAGTEQVTAICAIVSEVVVNSMRHARSSDTPTIRIVVACQRCENDLLLVWVVDDGTGLAKDFEPSKDGGVGSRVVQFLSQRLGAAHRFEPTDSGLHFCLELPVKRLRAG